MDEKKTYSFVGKVEIGTDEYRDLIEKRIEEEKRADHYRDMWYAEQTKVNDLKKEIELLKEKITKFEKFIKKNSVNISEEGITLFMSMFGEE